MVGNIKTLPTQGYKANARGGIIVPTTAQNTADGMAYLGGQWPSAACLTVSECERVSIFLIVCSL